MRSFLIPVYAALLLVQGCGPFYGDSGTADPPSWWSWVCDDGSAAPDTGCPPPADSGCPDSGGPEAGTDGGC